MSSVFSSVIHAIHTINYEYVTSILNIFTRPSSTRPLVTVNKFVTVINTALEFRTFRRCPRKRWVSFCSSGQIGRK